MSALVPLVLAFGVGLAVAQVVTNSTLQVNLTAGQIVVRLPPDLCGFSIEADRWPDWAGNVTHKNNYTFALLDILRVKTGVAAPIRVGGGTQDGVIYYPVFPANPGYVSTFPAVPAGATSKQLFPEASSTKAGYNYYLCAGNMPNGTAFTWGVNFASGNMSETVAQVQVVDRAFADPYCQNVTLKNIEMGNEEDTLQSSVSVYMQTQVLFFNAINTALGNNGRKYRTGDFAKTWNIAESVQTGIMNSSMGPVLLLDRTLAFSGYINAFAEHHYQADAGVSGQPSGVYGAAEDLIMKSNIRNNLAPYNVSIALAKNFSVPYVLGETGTFSGHGLADVSNTAAAAFWMVDYSLQAATIGISTLYYHNGIGYNYSAFEPLDNIGSNITAYTPTATRHILPQYYGYLMVADAIGNTGKAYINELTTDSVNLAAYQIWESCTLKRIMLINGVAWTNVSTGARPVLAANIPALVDQKGVTYKLLNISSIDDLHGLTWGGQSWENYNGMATGEETFESVGTDGTINMQASSAVLVYL